MRKTSLFLIWTILTTASIFDAKSYRIPNQLIILGYGAGICLNLEAYGMMGIAYFILKAAWPIFALSLLYILGKGLGAGDIKLFSVMSSVVGSQLTVDVMVTSVIIAGCVILVLSLYRKQLIKGKLHYSFYMTAAFFLLQFKS
ncbi:prepilin peptidase [Pseudobutyrivibrio sp. MD2005]|uniref:prepilin peptidase n=1 Tax=Pseudobutyrivibrio sp. MD2005 TaxID=1410616 RepID=UPI0018CC2DD5|nr:prepilin peptidase [Pseudobutyrivibrio sp. MD2005]